MVWGQWFYRNHVIIFILEQFQSWGSSLYTDQNYGCNMWGHARTAIHIPLVFFIWVCTTNLIVTSREYFLSHFLVLLQSDSRMSYESCLIAGANWGGNTGVIVFWSLTCSLVPCPSCLLLFLCFVCSVFLVFRAFFCFIFFAVSSVHFFSGEPLFRILLCYCSKWVFLF